MREFHKNYPYAKRDGFIQKYTRKDNKSGITGVCYDKTSQKWDARLNYNHIFYFGGKHETKNEAVRARLNLEFDVFAIHCMPQFELIPEYFNDPEDEILIAYNEEIKQNKLTKI